MFTHVRRAAQAFKGEGAREPYAVGGPGWSLQIELCSRLQLAYNSPATCLQPAYSSSLGLGMRGLQPSSSGLGMRGLQLSSLGLGMRGLALVLGLGDARPTEVVVLVDVELLLLQVFELDARRLRH